MAATYSDDLLTNKDWVRFLSGDRDTDNALLQDEEIAALLVENHNNKYLAAAAACEMILSLSGGLVEKQVEDLRLKWGESADSGYRNHIKSLKAKGARQIAKSPALFRVLGTRSTRT